MVVKEAARGAALRIKAMESLLLHGMGRSVLYQLRLKNIDRAPLSCRMDTSNGLQRLFLSPHRRHQLLPSVTVPAELVPHTY